MIRQNVPRLSLPAYSLLLGENRRQWAIETCANGAHQLGFDRRQPGIGHDDGTDSLDQHLATFAVQCCQHVQVSVEHRGAEFMARPVGSGTRPATEDLETGTERGLARVIALMAVLRNDAQ